MQGGQRPASRITCCANSVAEPSNGWLLAASSRLRMAGARSA